LFSPELWHLSQKPHALSQLKYFVAKMPVFENSIAEYVAVFEKRKRRKPASAAQKTMIG
jgi:hypothetical protein